MLEMTPALRTVYKWHMHSTCVCVCEDKKIYSRSYELIMYPGTWLLHSVAQSQWRVTI